MTKILASELIASIGLAIREAQAVIQREEGERFWSYFEKHNTSGNPVEGATGVGEEYRPKVRYIKIGNINAMASAVDDTASRHKEGVVIVPTASLVPVTQLQLSDVHINIPIKVELEDDKVYVSPCNNASADKSSGGDDKDVREDQCQSADKVGNLNLEFKIVDGSEGMHKVVQRLNGLI